MTVVSFGGLSFDDGSASGFHLSRLIGWDDGAPVRYESDPRPSAHGSFRPGRLFRGARVVSVEGTWTGGSVEEAFAARRVLAGLQADGLESPFAVTDLLGTLMVDAGLSGAPEMDDELFSPFFRFSFDVVAADPFRYGVWVPAVTGVPTASSGLSWPRGTSQIGDPDGDGLVSTDGYTADSSNPGFYMTTGLQQDANGLYVPLTTGSTPYWDWGTEGVSGRVSASNTGTADTYSTFEVTGGLSGGFMLTWVPTGAEIRFVRPILTGSTVFLNPRTGRASIDGQSDVSGFLTKSEWWPVLPGEVGEVQFTPLGVTSGTPTLTVRTAAAFV